MLMHSQGMTTHQKLMTYQEKTSLTHSSVFSTTGDTTISKEFLEMTFNFSQKDSAAHPVIAMCDKDPTPGSSPDDGEETCPLD